MADPYPPTNPNSIEYAFQQNVVTQAKAGLDLFKAAVLAEVGQIEYDKLDFQLKDQYSDPRNNEYIESLEVYKYKGQELVPVLKHTIFNVGFDLGVIQTELIPKIQARLA